MKGKTHTTKAQPESPSNLPRIKGRRMIKPITERRLIVLRQPEVIRILKELKLALDTVSDDLVFINDVEVSIPIFTIEECLKFVYADFDQMLYRPDQVVDYFRDFLNTVNTSGINNTVEDQVMEGIEHTLVALTEIVTDELQETGIQHDGTFNFYLFRVLPSGGLCFVPGLNHHQLQGPSR